MVKFLTKIVPGAIFDEVGLTVALVWGGLIMEKLREKIVLLPINRPQK